nr:MFS transporter [Oceanicola granulosus]
MSYGPARMGFGLFVPEFRTAFGMSPATVGIVSSLGFAGFFLGLLVAQWLLNRKGPKVPVLAGLAAAALGLMTVTAAPNVAVLAGGVFLAAASAGFAWTPFNDAVHRKIRDTDRPTALSEISTGTTVGVVVAASIALAMSLSGFHWRICWAIFAALAALALAGNWAALRHVEKAPDDAPPGGWRDLLRREAVPLFALAFVFGVTSAIYISFATDRYAGSGLPGLPQGAAGAAVFISYGLFGLTGLATGRVEARLGLPWLARGVMLAGAASLALAGALPGWVGLVASAGLQGVHVMVTSAVIAFWSERLFPALPSLSFTAVLLATAAGSILGPAIAGLVSGSLGPGPMFLGAAILPLATVLAGLKPVAS